MELLFQVKEEPGLRRTQAECLHEKRDSEEESSVRTGKMRLSMTGQCFISSLQSITVTLV